MIQPVEKIILLLMKSVFRKVQHHKTSKILFQSVCSVRHYQWIHIQCQALH